MLYKVKTQKVFTGGVAAIVTRFDGYRSSYSVHPNRSAAYFHGKALKRRLTREYKAAQHARWVKLLAGVRALPGWPVSAGV